MHHYEHMHLNFQEARLLHPADLIGANEAAAILNVSKPTITRRVAAGTLKAFTQLDGCRGAFIFDRNDVLAAARLEAARPAAAA